MASSVEVSPALVGVLYDFPQPDGGALFEDALRLGLEASRRSFDRGVELLSVHGRGLPSGTAHEIGRGFGQLAEAGVLAVLGPSISDNALVVQPLADALAVPCINYSGGERTRSHWMFHYQVGSLQEEPMVLAGHLAGRGLKSVALAHDRSAVGRLYAEAFSEACASEGVEISSSAAVSPLAEDLAPMVQRLRSSGAESLCYLGLGVAARALALAVADEKWDVPVVANSALMFGYGRKDWRAGWEGWVYVDTVSDRNAERAALRERAPRTAAGPIGVAAYDMGRMLGEAFERTSHLTRGGVHEALESVKAMPAASGSPGTVMGFGPWDHGALKGPYLVLRTWRGGRTVEYVDTSG
ncbi:MAG TPA: ABC transporter substrate-binding protein [Acidimicrobiaceae bacterium]|nr:ABC transporter substrate-binding protein [Acidimicrobiaceae bacterium]